jgi:hypothetical protein
MKALITLIAMTVLTCSAFASSPYGPNVESAEGKAVILNHVGQNFAEVKIKDKAAKLLYFAMNIAPTTSHDHITQLPIETKEIGTTVCDRMMQKDSSVAYECTLFPDLEKLQN